MASNSFGQLFRITTFGESHGPCIGVVIDGCPAGLEIREEEIDAELALRRPGQGPFTSPRKEEDTCQIISGVYEGKTTGAPLTLMIANKDADSSQYKKASQVFRPGHANFTYLEKYGIFDPRGGGRASARETAARVAAGAVAKKLLAQSGAFCVAYLSSVSHIKIESPKGISLPELRKKTLASAFFCPDPEKEKQIKAALENAKQEGDSIGGTVTCLATLPAGLGDPIYEKIEARLAYAMLSIPATKAFEIGSGFEGSKLKGSEHNDGFCLDETGNVKPSSNQAGGSLGGITTGAPLVFKVGFKPTSSIKKPQKTLTLSGKESVFTLDASARHDPCVTLRAPPIVEAMTALVLADRLLYSRMSRLC